MGTEGLLSYLVVLQFCADFRHGVVVLLIGHRTRDSQVTGSSPGRAPPRRVALDNLVGPVCVCDQAVQYGTDQRVFMLCSWEGNRRSGVALAMCHKLSDISNYWLVAKGMDMSTLPMAL